MNDTRDLGAFFGFHGYHVTIVAKRYELFLQIPRMTPDQAFECISDTRLAVPNLSSKRIKFITGPIVHLLFGNNTK